MDDIQRRDRQVFTKRLFSVGLVPFAIAAVFMFVLVSQMGVPGWLPTVVLSAWMITHCWSSFLRSRDDRFHDHRLLDQWKHCEDRLKRLRASLNDFRRNQIADLTELPQNVDRLARDLYVALRRADLVMYETAKSEGRLGKPRTVTIPATPDRQAQELLRQADRNIAEYNAHMQKLMASVQRTEAQVMVFITTLDSLRARMLHYKASPRPAEVDNNEFMAAIKEAKMQFDAIDKALDELDGPVTATALVASTPAPASVPAPVSEPEDGESRLYLGSLGPPPVPPGSQTSPEGNAEPLIEEGHA